MIRFCLLCANFVTNSYKNKKSTEKQSCKGLFILAELPIVWLLIGSDNIYNGEVNGEFAKHIIVHNWLTQNQTSLKIFLN